MKRNFFKAKRGAFIAGGLSRRHGPYVTTGFRRGPVKLKTSIGLQGHRGSAMVRLTRKLAVGIRHNFTHDRTRAYLEYRKGRFRNR